MKHLIEETTDHSQFRNSPDIRHRSACGISNIWAENAEFTHDKEEVDCKTCRNTNFFHNRPEPPCVSEMELNLYRANLEEAGLL